MGKAILNRTTISGKRVDFSYNYPEEWNVFVTDPDDRLFAEYDFDLAEVPVSILNIPFVANMLTISMFEDGDIYVEELDRDFYEAIPKILDGYRWIYPDRKISCRIHCEKLVDNRYTPNETKLMAFTGGVDATSALASHVDEKLVLVNIWGGDIRFDNEIRYRSHAEYFRELTEQLHIGFAPVKSNFRFLYRDALIPYKFDHDWWAAVGHSLLIVATFAPIAYHLKAGQIYLASTYTAEEYVTDRPSDCNYSGIVNVIKIASCVTSQCDGGLTRIQKVNNIVTNLNRKKQANVQILACWQHGKDAIGNCCSCEKCARTIMDIIACKADPKQFGFAVNEQTFSHIKWLIQSKKDLPRELWVEIQNAFLADKKYWKKNKNVNWIFHLKINQPNRNFYYLYMSAYWKLRQICGLAKKKLLRK